MGYARCQMKVYQEKSSPKINDIFQKTCGWHPGKLQLRGSLLGLADATADQPYIHPILSSPSCLPSLRWSCGIVPANRWSCGIIPGNEIPAKIFWLHLPGTFSTCLAEREIQLVCPFIHCPVFFLHPGTQSVMSEGQQLPRDHEESHDLRWHHRSRES